MKKYLLLSSILLCSMSFGQIAKVSSTNDTNNWHIGIQSCTGTLCNTDQSLYTVSIQNYKWNRESHAPDYVDATLQMHNGTIYKLAQGMVMQSYSFMNKAPQVPLGMCLFSIDSSSTLTSLTGTYNCTGEKSEITQRGKWTGAIL